jgi:peptidoglycan/LPS O-acetylase OafA/YrhL
MLSLRSSIFLFTQQGIMIGRMKQLPPATKEPCVKTSSKHNYIDAVRGWAILLVMTCHVGGMFSEMPYPVKKLTNFGWHGVQMFFLVSAVTLLMSWHRRPEHDWTSVRSFFVRRFLRIAPMYYAGALIYYLVEPPASGFDPIQALRTFAFVNAWSPEWIPTTPGWMVVPGGWSIGVEFTFYLVFPALAAVITTLPRAMILVVAALILSATGNHMAEGLLTNYNDIAVNNFLYFWFPNQAPVFALGFVLYFLVSGTGMVIKAKATAYALLALTIAAALLVAEYPAGSNRFGGFINVPPILIATLSFMGFIFVMASGPETFFTHRWIRRLGTLSFSAYVLHFLFVHSIPGWTHGLIDLHATGYAAIAAAVALWLLTVSCTMAAATIAQKLIEQPGIALAQRLTSSRRDEVPGPGTRTIMNPERNVQRA